MPDIGDFPDTIPVFPLTGVLLLPRGRLPLNIFEPRYLAMTRDALGGPRLIGMVQPSDPHEGGMNPAVYPVGCAGRITAFSETDDGRYLITLTGVSRFRIREELALVSGYRRVVPEWAAFGADLEPADSGFDRARLVRELRNYFSQRQIEADWDMIDKAPAEHLVTSIAMLCPFAPSEKQALLEASDLAARAELLTALVEMAAISAAPAGGSRH
ncbi:MAG TPA: LON peptidase substrate-binding domain-containing protein [Stellaceae bacterium]|jgi:Lon protease-like protein|nr:LON peptidase substrate-binding domain-containing protein [Stellaceae bacterium]